MALTRDTVGAGNCAGPETSGDSFALAITLGKKKDQRKLLVDNPLNVPFKSRILIFCILWQVRRAGAIACVRLFNHAPSSVQESGIIDALYEGLRDADPIVITNCILALDHILQNEDGVVVNKNIAHYLLGRIMEFSEFNAAYVLNLLLRLICGHFSLIYYS